MFLFYEVLKMTVKGQLKKLGGYIKSHYKKILITFFMGILLFSTLWFFYDYYLVLNKIDKDYYQIEYGQDIPDSIYFYINPDKIHSNISENDFHVIVKGKNLDEERLLNGVYQVQLSYKEETKDVKVEVKDTQEPQFTSFKDKITLIKDSKDNLLEKGYWKAEDKLAEGMTESAQVRIDGDYNLSKVGKYTVNIIAKDKNGLETKKPVTIEVLSYEDAYKADMKDKNNKGYTKYCQEQEEKIREAQERLVKQKSSSSSSSHIKGVVPVKKSESKSESNTSQNTTQQVSGKRTSFHDITGIRNAAEAPQFSEYKQLCQELYDCYINHKSYNIQFEVPKSVDYKQLLNQIEEYMFDIPIPGHNWGTGAIEGEETTRCAVRVYESSIERYKAIKDVGQWVKNQGLVGLTEEQAVNKINSYLRDNTNYDYSYQDDAYEPIGILKNKKAVCDGYAKFFDIACKTLGIESQYVAGIADGGNGSWGSHAWNQVKIGSTWYYIDTCWNACLKDNSYYLSKTLWSNHRI